MYKCVSRVTMLMKLAMEKTFIEVDVSLRMLIFWCVIWYMIVRV